MPYTVINVGAQELTKLPRLPASVEEAVKIQQSICGPLLQTHGAASPVATTCELIDTSACQTASGQPLLTNRFTGWGGNSITFTTNPNPDLFRGKRPCVGSSNLQKVSDRLSENRGLAGVLIDSLGANFPANLNYRKEHFAFARYPLTCDSSGRVALHNQISHYEFLDALRKQLREQGKFLFANGIYPYRSRGDTGSDEWIAAEAWLTGGAEHYRGRGTILGRFFSASLLDAATSEAGLKANQSRYEFYRVTMGKKLYIPTNATWEDPDELERYYNKCIVYALFATNVRLYNMDVAKIKPYYPEFYRRDTQLRAWFVPKVRLLSRAGWEPVTCPERPGTRYCWNATATARRLTSP